MLAPRPPVSMLARRTVAQLAVALAIAGCAAPALDAAPSSAAALVPGTTGSPRAINVIMRDYLFEPDPIRLVPGETVRFNIINAGLLAHEFVLGDAGVQAAWASAEAAATPPGFTATPPPVSLAPEVAGLRVYLESGGFATVDYLVPTDVRLELACRIPGHFEQGMVGTVELVESERP